MQLEFWDCSRQVKAVVENKPSWLSLSLFFVFVFFESGLMEEHFIRLVCLVASQIFMVAWGEK